MSHPSSLPELRERYGARYRWLLLFAVMVGSIAAILSSTIVNVAVPGMSRHFAIGQERAQWVSSGFMVAMTVAMLTTPWLLARFGYRRTYGGTMVLLLAGGVLGGFADHFSLVLLARVAEGVAAGAVQPIPAIVVMRAFEPHERGRAMGVFGTGSVLAPALGPSIGGVLVDLFGWRSIFFLVVPFCLASLWLSSRYVPDTAPGGAAPGEDSPTLDWISLVLSSTGTLLLLNALVELHAGLTPLAAVLLLGTAAAIAVFIRRQHRLGARQAQGGTTAPLVNQALYANRRFAFGSLVAFTYGMALFGSTYLLPIYMQLALQLSPSLVGTLLVPSGLVLAVTIALVGRISDRQPTHVLVCTGLALLTLSLLLNVTVHLGTALWVVVAYVILGRIGLGFILPSLNLGAMRSLHPELITQAASAISFARTLGGATGVSLCGIVLEWRIGAHGDDLRVLASSAQRMAAFNETFAGLALLCALSLAAAWQLREPKPAPSPH